MADGKYEESEEETPNSEPEEQPREHTLAEGGSSDDGTPSDSQDQHTEVIAASDESNSSTDHDTNRDLGSSDQPTEILSDRSEEAEHLPELLGFVLDDEEPRQRFDDTSENDSEDEGTPVRSTSWWKVLGGVAAACLAVALVAWGLGLPDSSQLAEPRNPAAAAEDVVTDSKPSSGDESNDAAESNEQSESVTKVKRENVGKPPKIAVQVFDTQQGACPPFFATSINVYVVKGQVDRAMARLTVPAEGYIRSYPLYEVEGDWSNMIRGIPTSRTAQLLVWVEGPNGRTEERHDITHECPGVKLDDVEKMPKKLKRESRFSFKIPKFDKLLESIEEMTEPDSDKKKKDESSD